MWKTILAVLVLIAATLFMPLWAQIVFYAIAIAIVPNRLAFFIPAAAGDALYAAESAWSLRGHYYVLLVAALLIVHYVVIHKTRLGQLLYGVEA